MEGCYETRLGEATDYHCADFRDDNCRRVVGYSPNAACRDYEVETINRAVRSGVRDSPPDHSHHSNIGPPDNNAHHRNSVANCDSMVAPGDSNLVWGGSPRGGEAAHPPRIVQCLCSVVVVPHPVANDRGVA